MKPNRRSCSVGYLEEMGVAGSTTSAQIAALFDSLYQDGGDARRVTVTQDSYVVEENLGEVDMGDWKSLAEYGVWAVNRYPARGRPIDQPVDSMGTMRYFGPLQR